MAIPQPSAHSRPRGIDRFVWTALIAFGVLLAGLSIARYQAYNAGMLDLGNMAQAIWSSTQGQPLVFTFTDGPTSRLALHVELIYFLFTPFYAIWPDPRLLLIVQAALFASGVIPTYRLAVRRIESIFAARAAALIYLLYPVAQTAVLFDFHGDTLAMPLLLFAIDALDRRAWRSYAAFIVLALSCKFYVAAPVTLLGWVIWRSYGLRRAALITSGAGAAYGALAFFVIRPLFSTAQTSSAHRGLEYITFYFGQFSELLTSWDQRLLSAIIVFVPVMFVAWRGWRWLVPALPVAAAALLSTGPGGSYDYRYHHYAIAVPFIVMAAVDGVARMRNATHAPAQQTKSRRKRNWRGDLGLTLAIVLIFNVALVDTPLNPLFWPGIPGVGLDDSIYGITARDGLKDRFLTEHVPPGAPIAASMFLAPHLANRSTLYVTRYPDEPRAERLEGFLPQVDYVLADALFDFVIPIDEITYAGGLDYDRSAIELVLRDPDFDLVARRDGLLLFQKNAPEGITLHQSIETLSDDRSDKPAELRFSDSLELMHYESETLGNRRLRVVFDWRITRPLDQTPIVAVSRIEGGTGSRIVHLPSYALLPPQQWRPGVLMRETLDITVPNNLPSGEYELYTGWYAVTSPVAKMTDTRSLIDGSQEALVGILRVP